MVSKFFMNSTSSLATIISWEGRTNIDWSTDINKMNESSFSLTTINNLLKLSRIVEASSGCCDGIVAELAEAKLGSCFCGWFHGAFCYEPCLPAFFLFLGAYFLGCCWSPSIRIKDYSHATNDPTTCPTKYISLFISIGSEAFGMITFSICTKKFSSPTEIPWIFMPSIIYLIATWPCAVSKRVHFATYNSIKYISTKSS